jgi:hypothetical protein
VVLVGGGTAEPLDVDGAGEDASVTEELTGVPGDR